MTEFRSVIVNAEAQQSVPTCSQWKGATASLSWQHLYVVSLSVYWQLCSEFVQLIINLSQLISTCACNQWHSGLSLYPEFPLCTNFKVQRWNNLIQDFKRYFARWEITTLGCISPLAMLWHADERIKNWLIPSRGKGTCVPQWTLRAMPVGGNSQQIWPNQTGWWRGVGQKTV